METGIPGFWVLQPTRAPLGKLYLAFGSVFLTVK